MNDNPPSESVARLLASTPTPDQHFLLRLMPYPPTAAERFLGLQTFVEAMQQSLLTKSARVEAFIDAVKLLRSRFGDLQSTSVRDLEECLARRLLNEFSSFVLLEC